MEGGKLIQQGAESRIYEGIFLDRKCVVKERFPKTYRHPELDERLTKERMRGELRGILRSKAIGIRTPAIYLVDSTKNAIVMELIENVETVNIRIGKMLGMGGAVGEDQLKQLARHMGEIIGRMHGAGIIHGDLTTSNILVELESPSLCLIDFGLSHVDDSPEDKAVDLYVLERALTSTFSTIPWFFEELLQTYRATYVGGGEEVFIKLEEVRLRGRKRTMVG